MLRPTTVNALSQLEDLIQEKRYGEVAKTLAVGLLHLFQHSVFSRSKQAIKEISMMFKSYTAVTRISRLWRRITEIEQHIKMQLDIDFDALYAPSLFHPYRWYSLSLIGSYLQDPNKPVKAALIIEACQVVDLLGPDVRLHHIERYVALELKEYRRLFRTNDEAGQLDNLSRRFAWFKRLLQAHELEQGRAFPTDWRVGWYLLAKFIESTRYVCGPVARGCTLMLVQGRCDHPPYKSRVKSYCQISS